MNGYCNFDDFYFILTWTCKLMQILVNLNLNLFSRIKIIHGIKQLQLI
jgi:hypothetical protein